MSGVIFNDHTFTSSNGQLLGIPITPSIFSLVFDPDNDEVLNASFINKECIKPGNKLDDKKKTFINNADNKKMCGICKKEAEVGWPYCNKCFETQRGEKCKTSNCKELTRLKRFPVGRFHLFCTKCRALKNKMCK
jgi:hypothetical protein